MTDLPFIDTYDYGKFFLFTLVTKWSPSGRKEAFQNYWKYRGIFQNTFPYAQSAMSAVSKHDHL